MKNLKLKDSRRKINKKLAISAILTVVLLFGVLLYYLLKTTNEFFANNYLQFNKVIELKFKPLFEVKEREIISPIVQYVVDYPDEIDTPLEKYICEKFGQFECKTALAIAKAESGLREDAFNANDNGSIDVGVFQINSVHFKKEGCALQDIVFAEQNVDCAYQIFKSNGGWHPWTVYKTGAFTNHYE